MHSWCSSQCRITNLGLIRHEGELAIEDIMLGERLQDCRTVFFLLYFITRLYSAQFFFHSISPHSV